MIRVALAVVSMLALTACGFPGAVGGGAAIDLPPISGEVEGVVVPGRDGAPPIECRRLPRDHCVNVGVVEEGVGGIVSGEVERIVVSCHVDRCDSRGGMFRIDVVFGDGTTQLIGNGGWGEPPGAEP